MTEQSAPSQTSPRPIFRALQFTLGGNYPDYLFDRLILLLNGQEIVHVESSLKRSASFEAITGELVVFTDELVAFQELTNDGGEPRLNLYVVPRSSLDSLESSGEAVDRATEHFGGARYFIWPYQATLTLRYRGLAKPLTLPLSVPDSSHIEAWRAFLPTLTADLLK